MRSRRAVLDVAHAVAQDAQEHAALGLGLDQPEQVILRRDADVEIAVGGQDDAIRPVLDEVLGGDVIGELDARAAVGRAAALQLIDRREDLRLLDARRRREDQARGPGIDDDRDPVVLAELLDQPLQAPLDQRQLVRLLHRAGDVDQEDEVAGRPLGLVDRPGGDPDPRQPVIGVPGTARDLDVHGERVRAGFRWRGIVVGEVVEQLLDADGILGRERVLREEAPDVGVAGRIHVDRERRQRLAGRPMERILHDRVIGLETPVQVLAKGLLCFEGRGLGLERLSVSQSRVGRHSAHHSAHAHARIALPLPKSHLDLGHREAARSRCRRRSARCGGNHVGAGAEHVT